MRRRIISIVLSMALVLGIFLGAMIQSSSKRASADDVSDPFDTKKLEADVENEIKALQDGEYVEGEAIVVLSVPEQSKFAKKGAANFDSKIRIESALDFGKASDLVKSLSKKKDTAGNHLYIFTVSSETYSTAELMRSLAKQENVLSVFPNGIYHEEALSNDAYAKYQWYMNKDSVNLSETGTGSAQPDSSASGSSLGMPQTSSQAYFYGSSSGVNHGEVASAADPPVVAVLDTGVNYNHEDLAGNMWTNPYGANVLKGTNGYDAGEDDNDPMDIAGHGTHCAGIIGALANNGKGIAGLQSNVKIMAVKTAKLSEQGEYILTADGILSGFDYVYQAQNAGVNVTALNCSFGKANFILATLFTSDSQKELLKSIFDKIGQKGALIVFAAGNDGIDMSLFANAYYFTYGSPYVVSVGSTGLSDQVSPFSNYSAKYVDIMAPGEVILSTYHQPVYLPDIYAADQKDRLCAFYNNVSDENHPLISGQELGLSGNVEITKDDSNDFAGDANGACYHVKVPKDASENGEIYIDITDLEMDAERNKYYYSLEAGIMDRNGIWWEHDSNVNDHELIKTVGQKRYFRLASLKPGAEFLIDNISISRQITNDADLGYYEFMNGTSMAAPVITAAVARLSVLYPNDNAVTRRAKLMASVRQVESLKNRCVSGGIVDFSKMTEPSVSAINIDDPLLASPTPSPTPKVTAKPVEKQNKVARKPEKVYLRSVSSPKKKTVKIRWYKSGRAKRYQVQVSKKRSFSKKKTRTTAGKKILIRGLKRKKKYFVRVRAYNAYGYGKWSKVGKVRVK